MLTPQRVAYPRDHAVPLALFRGRIIDQHAVHGAVRPVAAVVPDAVVANARHDEESGSPFVDDACRRAFLRKECGGWIVVRIGNGLHRQIGAVIVVKKRRPVPPSGSPASRVKIVTGISTLVLVLGIAYRRHSVSPANASAGMSPVERRRLGVRAGEKLGHGNGNQRGSCKEISAVHETTLRLLTKTFCNAAHTRGFLAQELDCRSFPVAVGPPPRKTKVQVGKIHRGRSKRARRAEQDHHQFWGQGSIVAAGRRIASRSSSPDGKQILSSPAPSQTDLPR